MESSFDSNKFGLAIHTSSPDLGLALSNFAGESRTQSWNLGRDLSSHLHQYLAEFIQPIGWKDLAFIAVAKGPGSFTGTRMGVVTARTLAQQLEIPLFAISSLAAFGWSHSPQPVLSKGGKTKDKSDCEESSLTTPIALQMPAQRGQLFTAIYQVSSDHSGLTQLLPDAVMTLPEWQQTLETWPTPYKLIDIPPGAGLGDSVSGVLELAYVDWQQGKRPHWSEALPYYGQHPVEDKVGG